MFLHGLVIENFGTILTGSTEINIMKGIYMIILKHIHMLVNI